MHERTTRSGAAASSQQPTPSTVYVLQTCDLICFAVVVVPRRRQHDDAWQCAGQWKPFPAKGQSHHGSGRAEKRLTLAALQSWLRDNSGVLAAYGGAL
jgi:hypothetical protein